MRRAREFRDTAWNTLRGKYWWAVLAALIAIVLGGFTSQSPISFRFDHDSFQRIHSYFSDASYLQAFLDSIKGILISLASLAFVSGIALFIVGSAIELGYDLFNVSLYQSAGQPRIEVIFSRFSYFGNALMLRFLMFLKTLLWSLLLIVPGIVAAYRYMLAPYLMAEHPELTPTEAIEQSKQLMLGHKGRLFCLHLSFIGWYILSAFTGGIGWFFLAPYVKAATTAFFLERTDRLPLPGANAAPVSGNIPGATAAPSGEAPDHELI